jgi:nitrate/nitrite transporter NarK
METAACASLGLVLFRVTPSALRTGLFVAKAGISVSFSAIYPWTSTLFPPSLRGLAMGACSAAGRVGGLLAPVLIDWLGKAHPALPLQAFAVAATLSAAVGGAMLGENYEARPPLRYFTAAHIGK